MARKFIAPGSSWNAAGNRHAGYLVSMVFMNMSRQSQERFNQLAFSPPLSLAVVLRAWLPRSALRGAPSASMEIFHRILQAAIEGGASDVHIKIDAPVIFRINRQLVAIEAPTPTEAWVNKIVETIVPRPYAQAPGRGPRNRFLLLRAGHRPVSDQPLPAARPILPLHALRQNAGPELRTTRLACRAEENRANLLAASCFWPGRPAAASPRPWRP